VLGLLVTANVLPSPPNLVTLKMEAIFPSETSVLTRATLRNVPEYCILLERGFFKSIVRKQHSSDEINLVGVKYTSPNMNSKLLIF
jgi:hypothetical protein